MIPTPPPARSTDNELQPRRSGADFTAVTESPGHRLIPEAISMVYTRYAYARDFCAAKDVLEVACGPGHGLGFLEQTANTVTGGDVSIELLLQGERHYRGRIPLVRMDAHKLPFADGAFDMVLLFEAIYYLADPTLFLRECKRVLRRNGVILICSANPEWSGFNPSPYSCRYYSARELSGLLMNAGFAVEMNAAFQADVSSPAVALIRALAVRAHLIPKTMKGKELLKRVFYGRLRVMGDEVTDGMAERAEFVPIAAGAGAPNYKVIYARGTRGDVDAA